MYKKRKKIKDIYILNILIIIIMLLLHNNKCVGYTNMNNEMFNLDVTVKDIGGEELVSTKSLQNDIPEISGKYFYIKNMLTGQYLDVQGGEAGNGINVWQYKFNGTISQQWYIHSHGDGTYTLYTPVGNDGTYFEYALDISNGSPDNYANVQIWSDNNTDSQKFSIAKNSNETYILYTKVSNYEKVVVVNGPTCNEGQNIDQYTYQNNANECWILEPVQRDVTFGTRYARANYQQYLYAYPDLTNFAGESSDCANFVSQSLLASGIHYEGDWRIYRKNFDSFQPTTVQELNNTWELCQPRSSPWISAEEFGEYWQEKVTYEAYKINYILENPDEFIEKDYYPGDFIQTAHNVLGIVGNTYHTMFITRYKSYNNHVCLALTYHSKSRRDVPLLEVCEILKNEGYNDFIIFYSI